MHHSESPITVPVAVVQMPMRWTASENQATIIASLDDATRQGAVIAVFPECATTGFHRRISEEATQSKIEASLLGIQDACARLGISAVVGTPFFNPNDDSSLWNAVVAIDANGTIAAICPKVGVTESERRFFTPGKRQSGFTVSGLRCSVILCREIDDYQIVKEDLAEVPQLMFWPSYIRNELIDGEVIIEAAATFAAKLGCSLVQANWPNSLNDPTVQGMGGSIAVDSNGTIIHRSSIDTPDIAILTLMVS